MYKDYGYQYNVPTTEETAQGRKGFSFIDFGKEILTGAVTGGMAGAAFYGAGKAVEPVKESIRNLRTPKQRLALNLQFFAEDGNKGGSETNNKITTSEHAEIRGSQGRNVNTAINDLNKVKLSNVYLQDDGRYVIKGSNGRVHHINS